MKIYLHIGYHKTGSSFLQMMLSQNRKFLLENKIHYPKDERDKDAKQGRISPGNGLRLSKAIAANNEIEFISIMESWINKAQLNKCDSILISNEGLFHAMAGNNYLNLFERLKRENKISEINGLVYFRDPFDHILSLYKHRGKRGTIISFKDWVENKYETLDLTEQFIDKTKSDCILWTFRKYKKDSEFMTKSMFSEWLKIESPEIPKNDRVNTSLTLSEIMVLRELNKIGKKEEVVWLQNKFAQIDKKDKALERNLIGYYQKKIEEWIKLKSDVIQKINNELTNESLDFKNFNSAIKIESANLSPNQLMAIINLKEMKNTLVSKLLNKVKRKLLR